MVAKKRPDCTAQLNPGENAKYLLHAMSSWDLEQVDLTDPKAVKERIAAYFKSCVDHDMKVGVVALARYLGISRQHLHRVLNGNIQSVPKDSCDTLKRAVTIIEEQMESYMTNGKIRDVAGIFLMKNNFHDYKDVQEIEVSATNKLDSEVDKEQLAMEYRKSAALLDYEDK